MVEFSPGLVSDSDSNTKLVMNGVSIKSINKQIMPLPFLSDSAWSIGEQ
jgi:hypothetical protein